MSLLLFANREPLGVRVKKGARQPTLAKRLADPATDGPRISVAWYGGTKRTVELASETALW